MNNLPVITLTLSLIVTFLASYLFTNAAEYTQTKTHLTSSFIGAIISPLFTSIPELTIFLIAIIIYKQTGGEQIGIGTLIGQPFMASTISYSLVLLSITLGYRTERRSNNKIQIQRSLALPFGVIAFLFPLTVVPSLFSLKFLRESLALSLIIAYILFAILSYKNKTSEILDEVDPYLHFLMKPRTAALTQFTISSAALYFGGNLMISSISDLSAALKINPLSFSIVIIPLATVIPETMTAIIWSFKGKDTLAISSIVGEKVLYSTIYPALGLLVTTWILDNLAFISIGITSIISFVLWVFIRRGNLPRPILAIGLPLFIVFVIVVLSFHQSF